MARLLDQIVGHQEIIQKLLAAAESQRLPSTFLFVGAKGVGKKAVALAFAQALLCEKSFKGCGVCGACLRVAKGSSEGLLLIEPEKNQIKIERSREILDFLSLRSLTKARVIVIESAESLNPQAANTLLKILEEPPEGTYFFLLAPSRHHVLPTLRSRSQIVSFAPLSIDDLKKKSNAPEWALRAAQGSFEKLAHLQESDELEIREMALRFLQWWLTAPQAYLLPEWRETVRDRSQALALVKHLNLLLRDAAFVQAGESENLLNPDQRPLLEKLSRSPRLLDTAQRALGIEAALLSHRDSTLVFEEFWLRGFLE